MSEDRTIQLLEEMRDLQKQNLESHLEAVRNQQKAIACQARNARVQRWISLTLVVIMIGLLCVLIYWK